jgi:pimeloyl-ACP methyl ester carboxylesterase
MRALSVLLTLLLVGSATFAAGAPRERGNRASSVDGAKDTSEPPGQLVTLTDHRLINLRCSGRGSPVVVLEAGFGASSLAWSKVQPIVAAQTRVCAYDRAGYAFSDPGPLPRDGAAIARDLDRALRAAGVRGPFILAGHSAGGLYVRLLAARRLHETVGLVLVDPSVEYQDRRIASVFGPGAGSVEGIRRRVIRCLDATTAQRASPPVEDAACIPKSSEPHGRMIALRPDTWRTQLSEIDLLFHATSDQVARTAGLLADVPCIVLTASPTGLRAWQEDSGAAVWQMMHRELAEQFHHGEQRIVRSGHLMMIDRPEIVAAAILEMVTINHQRTGAAQSAAVESPLPASARPPYPPERRAGSGR